MHATTLGRLGLSGIAVLAMAGLGNPLPAGEVQPMVSAQDEREPAKLLHADMPPTPPLAAGGGAVLLELEVDDAGRVSNISVLTDTPPFTDQIESTVRSWRFRPAQSEEGPVPGRVLVAAYYREPAFYTSTSAGEPPRVISRGSPEIPYPERVIMPPFPPMAYDEGISLVSAHVGPMGNVEKAEIVGSTGGFGDATLDAVRQWQFEPAEENGSAVPAFAYVLVAFRQPIVP